MKLASYENDQVTVRIVGEIMTDLDEAQVFRVIVKRSNHPEFNRLFGNITEALEFFGSVTSRLSD